MTEGLGIDRRAAGLMDIDSRAANLGDRGLGIDSRAMNLDFRGLGIGNGIDSRVVGLDGRGLGIDRAKMMRLGQ